MPKNMTAAVKKKCCSGTLLAFFFLLQDKLVQHRIHRNVDILKLRLKKSAIRVLDTDNDLKHSSTTVAELVETTLSRYRSDCHKSPTSNPKKSWKHAWEQAGVRYTSSVRRDESQFLRSWRKAVWPRFGKLKASKNEDVNAILELIGSVTKEVK